MDIESAQCVMNEFVAKSLRLYRTGKDNKIETYKLLTSGIDISNNDLKPVEHSLGIDKKETHILSNRKFHDGDSCVMISFGTVKDIYFNELYQIQEEINNPGDDVNEVLNNENYMKTINDLYQKYKLFDLLTIFICGDIQNIYNIIDDLNKKDILDWKSYFIKEHSDKKTFRQVKDFLARLTQSEICDKHDLTLLADRFLWTMEEAHKYPDGQLLDLFYNQQETSEEV